MGINDDPYFAGRIVDKPSGKLDGTPTVSVWLGASAANLVVPGILGIMLTDDRGRIGMALGVGAVLAFGYRVCFIFRVVVRTIAYGGWLIAVTQCIPIVQIIAGSIGVETAREFGLASGGAFGPINTVVGGFVATLITGGLLLALAFAIGMACRGLSRTKPGN